MSDETTPIIPASTTDPAIQKDRSTTMNVLAYIGVIGFFALIGVLLFRGLGNMTTEESFIIGNVTGIAGTICTTIISYYFGSSRGSAAKDRTIEKQMSNP